MTKHVLFVQGGGKGAHDAWDSELVTSLERALGSGYAVRYPRMPREDRPNVVAWKRAIARELGKLGDGAALVGHSVGAAILLAYLAEAELERRPSGVFLIAPPFIGGSGWPSDELRPTKELAADLSRDTPIHFYHGRDDETVPLSHVDMFAKVLPWATIRRLDGRDHQLDGDLSEVAADIRSSK